MAPAVAAIIRQWPRTPAGLVAGLALIAASVAALLTAVFLAALVVSEDGETGARSARARIRPGMAFSEVVAVTVAVPSVTFSCSDALTGGQPPCHLLRLTSKGSWLSTYSFTVTLDETGSVTSITEPEYDAW